MKHIYWFAYYNLDSPSVRYRGKYALDYLCKNSDTTFSLVIPGYKPALVLKFVSTWLSAAFFRKKESLVVIQRVHSNFLYAGLLKLLVKINPRQTVYDLDDADYLEHSPESIYWFLSHCEYVMVGSTELIKNFSPVNQNTFLNTSPVPDLNKIKQHRNRELTIGWIGDFGGGHKDSLVSTFFPSLLNLPFPVRLVMLGVGRKSDEDFQLIEKYFRDHKNITVDLPRNIDWSDEAAIQERICGFDIGIATLQDTELHRSKSAFKLKQYLACGVPVLSSDIAENNRFVRNGQNGFLCHSSAEFRDAILTIQYMTDQEYSVMSQNARNSLPAFNLENYCNVLKSIYQSRTIKVEKVLSESDQSSIINN